MPGSDSSESTWEGWRALMTKDAFLAAHGERVFSTSAIPCECKWSRLLATQLVSYLAIRFVAVKARSTRLLYLC